MSTPRNVFRKLRSKARTGILVEGAALLFLAFAVFMVATYTADRTLRLEVGYRLVLLLVFLVAAFRLVQLRTLGPLSVTIDDEEFALAVERADPGLRQSLISALQFEDILAADREVPESRELMDAVVQDVERRTQALGLQRALDGGRVARHGSLMAASLAVPLLWAALDPDMVRLWALRNLAMSGVEWPRDTMLSFAGTDGNVLRVAEGDDQTIVVRAEGVVPEQAFLLYEFAGGETGSEPMTLTGENEFSFTLQSLLDDVTLRAEAGDGLTPELRIQIVERPRLDTLDIQLVYPEYVGKDPETISGTDGDIRVPRGGSLRLAAHYSKPLQSATLSFGQEERVPLQLGDDGQSFRGDFTPPATGALTVNVVDVDRLDARTPPRLFLRLVEDAEPKLDFAATGIGMMITPVAIIPGALSLTDDYGLSAVDASFEVSGGDDAEDPPPGEAVEPDTPEPEEVDRWEPAPVRGLDPFVAGSTEWQADVAFDLKDINPDEDPDADGNRVHPGQLLSLKFGATDNFGPGEPHRGESAPVTFRVVTREKLLGDLERRQTEQRREVEVMVADEKTQVAELREILSPTAGDDRAARAKLRVLAMARTQRALGKRIQAVANSYHQILEEYRNNRILEPSKVAELDGQIVQPLRSVAEDEFPASAAAVQEFAESGKDDVRDVAVLSYETIIQRLEQVLTHMKELETFATLLEDLRNVIKLQNAAIREADKRRKEEASGLFDPARQAPGKKKRD